MLATVGCLLVGVTSMCLFMWGAMARSDDIALSNSMFRSSFIVLAAGATALIAAQVIITAVDLKLARAAERALMERAATLRAERQRRRQQQDAQLSQAVRDLGRQPLVLDDAALDIELEVQHVEGRRATQDVGTCPLCQTTIVEGEQYLNCPLCSVPYHEDCWKYNRGCAVRGCPARLPSSG